ncbi:5-formyltetrahydrofolate cyclo-ligase [Algoriphagus namhaensis]
MGDRIVMESKDAFRRKAKKKRALLSTEEIEVLSQKIFDQFTQYYEKVAPIRMAHVFLPIARLREVNTRYIIDFLHQKGVVVCTSVVDNDQLNTVRLEKDEELTLDAWQIPIPKKARPVSTESLDLVLVPLLAVDQKGYRIGYGRGYYDRFLGGLGRPVRTVGLGFFEPETEVPHDENDIILENYISPNFILSFFGSKF